MYYKDKKKLTLNKGDIHRHNFNISVFIYKLFENFNCIYYYL